MIRKYILNNYKLINDFSKDYIKTIFSHYSNTFLHLIFNLIQIPIFLKIFNNHEFGIILFLISLINLRKPFHPLFLFDTLSASYQG